MVLPFADNGGVRIYYLVEGTGRPLVLLHGFGGSSEQFYFTGWVDALRSHYRLILMDARGHGKSSKPHEPDAYQMQRRVGDVTAVLDDLGIDRAHFLGYSGGGEVGFGIAKYAPERFTSLLIGGADAEDPDPERPSAWSVRTIGLLKNGIEVFAAAAEEGARREILTTDKPSVLEAVLPLRLQLARKNDPEALIALLTLRQRECLSISQDLPRLDIPCLIFVGEEDGYFEGARAASKLISHARFVSFPRLMHFETAARVDLVLPSILGFLSDVDKKSDQGA